MERDGIPVLAHVGVPFGCAAPALDRGGGFAGGSLLAVGLRVLAGPLAGHPAEHPRPEWQGSRWLGDTDAGSSEALVVGLFGEHGHCILAAAERLARGFVTFGGARGKG